MKVWVENYKASKPSRVRVKVHRVTFPKESALKDNDGHHLAQRLSPKECFPPRLRFLLGGNPTIIYNDTG